jgi:CheY-like chemotaxis protein
LNQVIINLLSNAIKFTHQGEIVLHVKPESMDGHYVNLAISVSDTGIGIPPEKQQLIFDAFAQIDASSTRKFGGTGLGLSISSRLVELMGGHIWLESKEGAGSTFYFTARFERQSKPQIEISQAHFVDVKGLPILVVDDNAVNLRVFDEILSHWGMLPTLVNNGQDAIIALQDMAVTGNEFSLILLDAMMPLMDGFMVAKAIREDQGIKPVTIMMLSSADRPDDFERCRKLGINLYVRKPVKHSELWSSIQSALGMSGAKTLESLHPHISKPVRRLKILLAEDNRVNQHMAVVLLEERGHTVHVANDGQETINMLAAEYYDLVLMDVQMPVMDGFQATKAIREHEQGRQQHTRIIAMTAHALKGDRERCLTAGMDGYIAKPVKEEELLATVENWEMLRPQILLSNDSSLQNVTEPVLDWQEALNRVRGRRKLLNTMMALFQEQSPQLLAGVEQAIQGQDAELLRRTAHTLKSSANSIGAFKLGEIAQELENKGQESVYTDVEVIHKNLQSTSKQLEAELEKYLREQQE